MELLDITNIGKIFGEKVKMSYETNLLDVYDKKTDYMKLILELLLEKQETPEVTE